MPDHTHPPLPRSLHALMVGNFVIGTGIMAVPGTLNDISTSLQVSVPQAGQLITAGAILMGVGAPLFATLVAGWDRRRLLVLCLLWYALFMGLCALAPSYSWLLPLRVLAVVPPAIFTPQAAACVGLLVPEAQRGKAITFVFLGWSVASVAGMPLAAWIGGLFGWRWAFALVAVLALVVAGWLWRAMPDGVRPAALSRQAWGQALGSPALMMVVGVTLLSSFGQFTLFSYFAPYHQQVLGVGAMALSLLLWPLGLWALWVQALVLVPWALGCFSANSAQQARLVHFAPALAPATVALNTSAIYGGQALGAALGGGLIAQGLMRDLHHYGLVLMLAAMALSWQAARRQKRSVGSR